MKTLIVLTAATALAACSQKTTTTPADTSASATTAGMAQAPSPSANRAATGSMAGKYEFTTTDGTVTTETINADGTYVDVTKGKETRGVWRENGAQSCFDPEGPAPEVCYTASAPGADGSFSVTGPDGKPRGTVRKVGAAPTR